MQSDYLFTIRDGRMRYLWDETDSLKKKVNSVETDSRHCRLETRHISYGQDALP